MDDAAAPDSLPALARPPAGIPPLLDDRKLASLMGGRVVPMPVGRPKPAALPPVADPVLAAGLSSTFSGAPADPQLKAAVTTARTLLGKAIVLIAEIEAQLPALLDTIAAAPEAARAGESFDIDEARAFHAALIAALNTARS